jgi:phosphoribosylformylglycinamidine synthase
MADTIAGPGGDAALVRVHGSQRGLAITTDCTPRYVEADPETGGKQAVAEAYRNICAIGARPLAITNNLNFGNPEKPDIMAQLAQSVVGMGKAAKHLDTPVVSGNVSLYNETDGVAIRPCPVVGMVGVIDDVTMAVGNRFVAADEEIFILGQDDSQNHGWLGASLYAAHQGMTEIYAPPPIDLDAEEQTGKLLARMIASGTVTAAHDISDGGLAVTIAEMCLHSSFGAHITPPTGGHLHGWAFGEDQARYVVTTADGAALTKAAQKAGIAISKIGTVTSKTELQFGDDDTISVKELKNVSEACLPDLMAG